MNTRPLPSVEYLNERLRYDKKTGKLYWKYYKNHPQRWNTCYAGTEAGSLGTYAVLVRLDRIAYQAHRLIWKMVYKEEPPNVIDHYDQNPYNNRLANLRPSTIVENARNQRRSCRNTSGTTGVCWDTSRSLWKAQIMVRGKQKNLGHYDDLNKAVRVRKAADRKYGFSVNHGRL